jgi:hypothetical protein
MHKWALILLGGLLLGVLPSTAWASKAGPVFDKYGATIHATFEPKRNAARFMPQTETLLLLSQLVSALIIIGGLLTKMRKDETQMEGIASMVLKVGIIASLPIIGGKLEETCGWMANETGHATFPYTIHGSDFSTTYTPATSSQVPKVVKKMFELANQWTIDSTPVKDQLDETSEPEPDQDEAWVQKAGNWAAATMRGHDDPAVATWAAVAGAFRVATLHVIVLGVDLVCTSVVFLTYFAEILRLIFFHAGLAILPVFIAGLGVECMKNQSVRYILGLVSIGLWPVGWAIANIGTVRLINVANNFISNLLKPILAKAQISVALPTIAVTMPHLGWGVMVMLVALTLGLCIWMLIGLICGPLLISRILTQGAHMIGGMVGAAAGTTSVSAANVTGRTAAPLAHAMTVAAGRSSAMMGRGEAMAGSASANGASMLGRVGGSNVGAAATSMASRFDSAVTVMDDVEAGTVHPVAAGLGRALGGSGGSMMRSTLHGASYVLEAAAPIGAGHESHLVCDSDGVAFQRRPRPWEPVLQPSPRSR